MSLDVTGAVRFDAAATDVAGVRALYAARPLVVRLATQVVEDEQPRTHVQDGAHGIDVTVAIGVDGTQDCADVAARVAESLRGVPADGPVENVRVRVSRLVFDA